MVRSWSDLSVRTRLTLGNVLMLALILIVLGGVLRYVAQVYFSRVVDRELAAFTRRPYRGGRGFNPGWGDRNRQGRWQDRREPGQADRRQAQGERPGGGQPQPERREGPEPRIVIGSVPAPPGPEGPRPPEPPGEPGMAPPPDRNGNRTLQFGGQRDNRPRFLPRAMNLKRQVIGTQEAQTPWDTDAFERSARGESLYSTVTQEGERYRVYSAPIRRDNQVIGVFQVAHPLSEMRRELDRLGQILFMVFPLALLAAGVGGYFLTERALRPIRSMTQAASRIEARNLSGRLPVRGRDEFSVLAATFNGMLERLEKAFDRQRRFTADASHELRTPLAAIKGDVSLALSRQRSAEEYREALESVNEASDRMNRIVQDLLFLARSEGDRLPLDLQVAPIRCILERAVSNTAYQQGAPVRIGAADPSLHIVGDEHHLERLFLNLVDNALRHTPDDGEIVLEARETGDKVVVTVADTGEGIAPEHIPHLFESFYRVDLARARSHGGTGLGLAICKSIVEAHGGAISLESTPGVGTTVTVTLPCARMTGEDE